MHRTVRRQPSPRRIRLFVVIVAVIVASTSPAFYVTERALVESQASTALFNSAAHQAYDPTSPLVSSINLSPLDESNPTLSNFPELAQWLRTDGVPEKGVLTPFSGDGYEFLCLVPASTNPLDPDSIPTMMLLVDLTASLVIVRQTALAMGVLSLCADIAIVGLGNNLARSIKEREQDAKVLFANASHQLKTPIAATKGYLQAIREHAMEAEAALMGAERSCDTMNELVEQILALSKADAGVLEPNTSRTDLSELAMDVLEDHQWEAQNRGIALKPISLSEVIVVTDRRLTAGIISNLVSNAVRHAATAVELRLTGEPRGRVTITVANDGEPMDENTLAHAFDRFYIGRDGSSGLGLPVAKAWAEALGGKVTLESNSHRTVATLDLFTDSEASTTRERPAGRPRSTQ